MKTATSTAPAAPPSSDAIASSPGDAELIDSIWSDVPAHTPLDHDSLSQPARKKAPEKKKASDPAPAPAAPDIPEDVPADPPDLEIPDGLLDDVSDPAPAPEPSAAEPDLPADEADPDKAASELKLDDKQKHAFSELAYAKRELSRENAELKKRLEESSNGVDPKVLVEKDEKIQALEDLIGKLDLSQSPAFQKKHDLPIKDKVSRMRNLLVRSGFDDAQAAAIIGKGFQMSDLNERIGFLSEEVPALQGALIGLFDEVEALRTDRERALEDWKAARAAMSEEEKQMAAQTQWKAVESLIKTTVDSLKTGGNFLFNSGTKDDRWNREVQERVDAFRGVLKENNPVRVANLVAQGVASAHLMKLFQQERTRRKALESELGKRVSRAPSVKGEPPAVPPAGADPAKPKSDSEIIAEIWGPGLG